MKDSKYEVSNTTLEAEWIQDKIWSRYWECSNCSESHDTTKDCRLSNYCPRCGAKMKNPLIMHIDYDYD